MCVSIACSYKTGCLFISGRFYVCIACSYKTGCLFISGRFYVCIACSYKTGCLFISGRFYVCIACSYKTGCLFISGRFYVSVACSYETGSACVYTLFIWSRSCVGLLDVWLSPLCLVIRIRQVLCIYSFFKLCRFWLYNAIYDVFESERSYVCTLLVCIRKDLSVYCSL